MPFLVGRHDASCLCGWVFWGDKKCGVHHARCTSAKCRDSSIQLASVLVDNAAKLQPVVATHASGQVTRVATKAALMGSSEVN